MLVRIHTYTHVCIHSYAGIDVTNVMYVRTEYTIHIVMYTYSLMHAKLLCMAVDELLCSPSSL